MDRTRNKIGSEGFGPSDVSTKQREQIVKVRGSLEVAAGSQVSP